jgi:hypothetical protein
MNLNTTISPSCQQTHPPKKKKKKKKKKPAPNENKLHLKK